MCKSRKELFVRHCSDFFLRHYCKGDCNKLHILDPSVFEPDINKYPYCYNYQNGTCIYGKNCRFEHSLLETGQEYCRDYAFKGKCHNNCPRIHWFVEKEKEENSRIELINEKKMESDNMFLLRFFRHSNHAVLYKIKVFENLPNTEKVLKINDFIYVWIVKDPESAHQILNQIKETYSKEEKIKPTIITTPSSHSEIQHLFLTSKNDDNKLKNSPLLKPDHSKFVVFFVRKNKFTEDVLTEMTEWEDFAFMSRGQKHHKDVKVYFKKWPEQANRIFFNDKVTHLHKFPFYNGVLIRPGNSHLTCENCGCKYHSKEHCILELKKLVDENGGLISKHTHVAFRDKTFTPKNNNDLGEYILETTNTRNETTIFFKTKREKEQIKTENSEQHEQENVLQRIFEKPTIDAKKVITIFKDLAFENMTNESSTFPYSQYHQFLVKFTKLIKKEKLRGMDIQTWKPVREMYQQIEFKQVFNHCKEVSELHIFEILQKNLKTEKEITTIITEIFIKLFLIKKEYQKRHLEKKKIVNTQLECPQITNENFIELIELGDKQEFYSNVILDFHLGYPDPPPPPLPHLEETEN